MTKQVISVRPDTSIDDAFALLLRHNISGLPVTNEDGHLRGVISELDLLGLLYSCEDLSERIVSDYWTPEPLRVKTTDSLPDVVEVFLSKPMRRLPVVDDNQHLVGVLSRRDLVRHIREVRMRVRMQLNRHGQQTATSS